ncbi:hypothetical protein GALMADRAFT_1326499 [Galerina marginata CBS 339.88]|uniref:Uncharacterized protein n=1 Tax=Galerina marginata (strain CBS 339.88) TaxID=685588 RepID=A0A067T3D4_GALM3|nr:hypothetical protein GALMADRAFT_1326499 [Galerina marginata CBS 339.88]
MFKSDQLFVQIPTKGRLNGGTAGRIKQILRFSVGLPRVWSVKNYHMTLEIVGELTDEAHSQIAIQTAQYNASSINVNPASLSTQEYRGQGCHPSISPQNMPPNPVIAFGASENSFYVGCGLKYYAPGVPMSLTTTIQTLPSMDMAWLSLDGEAQAWIAREKNSGRSHYSTNLPTKVVEALNGSAKYVTLGRTKEWYFVKPGAGQWIGNLHDETTKGCDGMRVTLGENFDAALNGIIFGKQFQILIGQGGNMLFMFPAGFNAWTDDEGAESNLKKLLLEYLKGNEWLLEQGSSLCQWNINYFYLIFKNKASGNLVMRWNLPEMMQTKLMELREYADTPQGKEETQLHEQAQSRLHTMRLQSNMAMARNIQMVASGGGWWR